MRAFQLAYVFVSNLRIAICVFETFDSGLVQQDVFFYVNRCTSQMVG